MRRISICLCAASWIQLIYDPSRRERISLQDWFSSEQRSEVCNGKRDKAGEKGRERETRVDAWSFGFPRFVFGESTEEKCFDIT